MVAALDIETVKKVAIVIVIVLVLLALLIAKIVRSVTTKAITILIIGALVFAVFSQRQSMSKCKDQYLTQQSPQKTTCSFFGYHVKLPVLPG